MTTNCIRPLVFCEQLFRTSRMSIRYAQGAQKRAVSAVKQRQLTIAQAAREFDVPRKTVNNNAKAIKGVYKWHAFDPKRMLNDEKEGTIVNYMYMEYMAEQGFPMTRAQHLVPAYMVQIVQQDNRKTLFNLAPRL